MLIFFYLEHCPYCKQASAWLNELSAENPAYAAIPIRRVEESREAALADSYDYWKVPSFFLDGKKLHEGAATKAAIKAVLDAALSAQN